MFTIDLSLGAAIYLLVATSLILGLWLYYDHRDRQLYEAERRRVIYHCLRCDKLYTGRQATELAPCPRCGHQNSSLKF